MKVVLLERVENWGGIGDVVDVRPGYARNYLLPQHKALRATEANLARFAAQRAEIEARNAETRARAQALGEGLEGLSFVLIRQAGESGQLYGSVSARDIAEAASAAGHRVERAAVVLDSPIKTIGVHPVRVRLHAEVAVGITVNVARSQDEADRQAKGEDVVAAALAEERAMADAQSQELAAASITNEPGAGAE